MNRLILITEFSFQTETSNFDEEERTTGTINPGLIYMADKFQLGIEASIPVNRASGDDIGVIGNAPLPRKAAFCLGQQNTPPTEWPLVCP